MNINVSIVDQRVGRLMEEIRAAAGELFGIYDGGKLKSLAFVYFCVKELLDLDPDAALDCITEGGGDFGVDAIHITEPVSGEFGVTLFQAKYQTNLDGTSNFPLSGLESLIQAVRHLFDPGSDLGAINDRMRARVEEVRSLLRDGYLPRVRAVCCNNGIRWVGDGDVAIHRAGFGDQVSWEHFNHDALIRLLQRAQRVDAILRFTGRAIVEDLAFSRVCIARIPVTEISDLMTTYGDRLLERNIRRYLGLSGNRVNEGIRATLRSPNAADFYLLNNGITVVCDDFTYNALQQSDYQVRVTNLQIVNGAQTCMTIARTAETGPLPPDATVLVRLYKLPLDREDLALGITHATNSQNPVDLKDLRANDEVQRLLETGMRDLGYSYRRKRAETFVSGREISSGAVAEAVLAVWRGEPHRAKFFAREHFGKLYGTIFGNSPTTYLNAAQAIAAVLLFRIAENHRRRPADTDPIIVAYASCFLAMQMGRRLLRALGVGDLAGLDHRNFPRAHTLIESSGEAWYQEACGEVQAALSALYGEREVSLQQLSATFRRGDLVAHLPR